MNPIILQFKELPKTGENFDYSAIKYDQKLNLSINQITGQPAIDDIRLETETFTRVTGEQTDSDCDNRSVGMLMATETATKTHGEGADADRDRIGVMMETATATFVRAEAADSDK